MGCLRRILRVTRRDHISNLDIKAKLKLEDDIVEKKSKPADSDILTRVQDGLDKCRLPYIALYGRVEGNRAKGRPRKRWLECWTVLQKTVNAVAGILWKLHDHAYGCHSVPRHHLDNKKKIFCVFQGQL